MKGKTYNYEKFTRSPKLLFEFKNAKKNQKIILGTFVVGANDGFNIGSSF